MVGGIIGEFIVPGNPWSTAAIVSGFSHFAYTINGMEDGGMTWDEASSYAGIYAEIPPIDINWPSFNNNDVVEYDPGATYEHPVTGQEYYANSGSETYDNTLANGGYYKNPGDMNYKASYDVYFGSNYQSGYVPAIDKLFCVFENAEYLSSVYNGGYDTNDYLRITQANNPEIDVLNVNSDDYYTIMRSNFKTGKGIETYSDIYHRINDGQPVSALIPGKPYHAVSIIGYNTTSYELIYMDPQIGIRRFTPQEILRLLGLIPIKRAK